MGFQHLRKPIPSSQDAKGDELYDIAKCGRFGRPLFAAMLQPDQDCKRMLELTSDAAKETEGKFKICNVPLRSILGRILLSSEDYSKDKNAVASVLATRVQLGIASFDFITKSTAKGYAMLVDFRGGEHKQHPDAFGIAGITFPPDPVCAALAMGVMQESWSVCSSTSSDTDVINGKEASFWVRKAGLVFDRGLFLPDRGDAGEVLATLYMLLCGDVLRHQKDGFMRKFEIDCDAWISLLRQEKENGEEKEKENNGEEKKLRTCPRIAKLGSQQKTTSSTFPQAVRLNFIQVCRNYFRSQAWFNEDYLRFLYDTACANYVYANCPAIDLVFPVKYNDKFHPALVSVKCWDTIGGVDMQNALEAMKKYLADYRPDGAAKAICMVVVVGFRKAYGVIPEDQGQFPTEDTFITVAVPESDKFGVSDAISKRATVSRRAEMLASHSFAHVENLECALRSNLDSADLDFGKNLLKDKEKKVLTDKVLPKEG
eukprot:CAMPEP_0118679020 /NCGR_PEP_ID=MMETSP0800-20121206/3549_1 /TAXON_ID=210618 ORGANISM="Striatella unipunctata, Strain CCMP2910" /NCGR_SAMPLE_ID=MMETSP0800 /ASSEMBLY_ACC=CAM_ASM_000638 /LENGTH=485 /DNA_ID=CAMNT_0006574955 /DNA_START=460 /DNA_END=1917 /DNA_ORIENTATION=+